MVQGMVEGKVILSTYVICLFLLGLVQVPLVFSAVVRHCGCTSTAVTDGPNLRC